MKPLLLSVVIAVVTSPLLASADLTLTAIPSATVVRAGYLVEQSSLVFSVHNAGPDTAVSVTLSVSSAVTVNYALGNMPAGDTRGRAVLIDAPRNAGPFTINATVTSNTPDPNPADNSASAQVTVSTDPDVVLSISTPSPVALAVPFPLSIALGNFSKSDAHDVDIAVNFPTDALVQSLPSGCSSPAAGQIVCHVYTLAADASSLQPTFVATIIAPAAYGTGSIVFTATATEREHDFDPQSNTSGYFTLLYNTMYVTTTANEGAGSLRQAILDANANCIAGGVPCTIAFRIDEPSPSPWKTIRITSPLPRVTAYGLRIDGATQTAIFGDTNADGPEVEISGGGTVDGDGLLMSACQASVANLVIGGFRGNGISITDSSPACHTFPMNEVQDLFLGTDPTGTTARPNGRGIGISAPNGNDFLSAAVPTTIDHCLISGNLHSGIFGLSGRLSITNNRIGVKAQADEPLPNGGSGVFIGPGGYGSDVGPNGSGSSYITLPFATYYGNVIAFNGETGVAIARGVTDVAVRNNRIFANRLLGIDIGLDGPTASSPSDEGGTVAAPTLTLAHYDPVSKKTIIEGEIPQRAANYTIVFTVNFFANDDANPSGYGQGQTPLGGANVDEVATHFHFEADGDLTGKWITATSTRSHNIGFAKPEGIDDAILTQTSEFSRAIEVR